MTVEPRRAGPGAIPRWIRQSFALMARGLGFWLGLILIVCLGMFLGQRFPLFDGMLALLAFFSSILIAARLDRAQRTTLGDVLQMLRAHAVAMLLLAAIIAIALALVWILLLARPGVPWWTPIWSERNLIRSLSTDWFEASRQLFLYSGYALGLSYFGLNIPGLTGYFQFPCATLLGLPLRAAYRYSAIAQLLNLPAILGIGLMFVTLPVLCLVFVPPLIPALYCFLGALTYVSFREIFLGIGENRVLEPQRAAAIMAPR
jgi:hypothetical protein